MRHARAEATSTICRMGRGFQCTSCTAGDTWVGGWVGGFVGLWAHEVSVIKLAAVDKGVALIEVSVQHGVDTRWCNAP